MEREEGADDRDALDPDVTPEAFPRWLAEQGLTPSSAAAAGPVAAWPEVVPSPRPEQGDSAPVSARPPGPDLYQPAPTWSPSPPPDLPVGLDAPGGPPPGPDLAAGWSRRTTTAGPLSADTPSVLTRLLRRMRGGS
ncbi:hypothetical protein [Catellatospora sp. NPDC049133]|uniref:hypothetical protein n=1 Tax=Catellatospora sp. NPDC049133 TaxID=3155499 RepID=UPI0033D3F7D6